MKLHDAVRLGKVHKLAKLAALCDVDAVDWSFPSRLTPLGLAAVHNRGDVVVELVRLGADVNRPDADGWKPMDLAHEYGSEWAMRELIAAGAASGWKIVEHGSMSATGADGGDKPFLSG